MLTVHHLGRSQSERIVWLCEELGIEYELKRYDRNPTTRLAPPELKALHPMGTAPVISDGELVLAESGAIVDYIIARYGGGRLVLPPAHPDYAQYLYWFHFANSNLQALLHRYMIVRRLEPAPDHPTLLDHEARLGRALNMTDKRLGAADYLAGKEFTAADIMIFFSLTTMRTFVSFEVAPYPNVLSYLRRIGERDGYRRAMQKGDPDRVPLLC
jgi:glutathione S-transferase